VLTIEIETEFALAVKFPKALEPLVRVVLSCDERYDRVNEKLSLTCSKWGGGKTGPRRTSGWSGALCVMAAVSRQRVGKQHGGRILIKPKVLRFLCLSLDANKKMHSSGDANTLLKPGTHFISHFEVEAQ